MASGMEPKALNKRENAELYLNVIEGLDIEKLNMDKKAIEENPETKYGPAVLKKINWVLKNRKDGVNAIH